MQIDLIELAIELFGKSGSKTNHVNDLAELADQLGRLPPGEDQGSFSAKLSAKLNANSKSKSPQFSRVKNKNGGLRRGVYRIRPQKPLLFVKEQPKVRTQFTGSAGEYAVMSELLFREFNASKMTVDDGIDVVASKLDKYFHVQVKTANERDGAFTATIRKKSFQNASNVFYIIVMRSQSTVRYVNDFAIFSSGEINRWLLARQLKDGASISLKLTNQGSSLMLNNSIDVSVNKNHWELIC